jgi:hypothetical protein
MLHLHGQCSPHMHATLHYDISWNQTMTWIYATPSCIPFYPHEGHWSNCTRNCPELQINLQDMSHQPTFLPCPSRPTRQCTSTTLETLWITTCWHPQNKNKQTKLKSQPKLIFTLTRSSVHFPIKCYNLLTNQWRSDSRGVADIQYCYLDILHISPLLITITRMHRQYMTSVLQ